MEKSTILTALLLVTGAANAASITSLNLTGGTFDMAGSGGTINPAAFSSMSVDGSYDGSAPTTAPGTEADLYATSVGTFTFGFFGPVAIYTAATDGINGPFPGVTGDITDTTLTLDLSSWTMYWKGDSINQGSAAPTITSFNAGTGDFTADWSALVIGGVANGQTGVWSITGNAQVVPAPAAVWLFGSGLIGLIGLARRKANA